MIKVSVKPNSIELKGHANTAPHGSDIVCAAVSALTLTLVQGLKNIAYMSIYERIAPGNICIEWQTTTDTGKALIDSWFLGMCSIAQEYGAIQFVND